MPDSVGDEDKSNLLQYEEFCFTSNAYFEFLEIQLSVVRPRDVVQLRECASSFV
jgi:hypothetical protein